MTKKYTERQLNEAISYWRKQLKENFNMTDEQIDAELNEGLWDMLRHPIASFKDYQQPFKDKASITGLKNLISQQFKKDPENCKKLQFWVKIGNDEFPVAAMQPMEPHKAFKLTIGKVLGIVPSNKKQADESTVTVEALNERMVADKLTLSKLSGVCLALVDGNGISETEVFEDELAEKQAKKTKQTKKTADKQATETPAEETSNKPAADKPAGETSNKPAADNPAGETTDKSAADKPAAEEQAAKPEERTVSDDVRSVGVSFNGKVVDAKLSPNRCTGAKVEPSKNRIVIGFDLTHVEKAKAKANGEDTGDNLGGLI